MIAYLIQKSKKASTKTNKQLPKTDMTTCYKMKELTTSKKCHTRFAMLKGKKEEKTARKKTFKTKIMCIQKNARKCANMRVKANKQGLQVPNKPGQLHLTTKKQNENFGCNFLN